MPFRMFAFHALPFMTMPFIISPFLKLKMLGVSSGGILVTIKEKKYFIFDRTLFRGRPAPPEFAISYRGKIC